MLMGVDNVGGIRLDAQRWALRRLQGLAVRLGRARAAGLAPGDLAPHLAAGLEGEQEAFFHLRRLGYTVVARRWRSEKLRGDLDLVAWDKGCLCFVEVKTRTRRDLVPAEFAVDEEKEKMLRRMAGAYLRRFPEGERGRLRTRFDIVSVYLERGRAAAFDVFTDCFR